MEINIDGLVGPTHHYGGLGVGNRASLANANQVSHPREGALQGLAKMWRLATLGIPQGFLPPCLRPSLALLNDHGFEGSIESSLSESYRESPEVFSAANSSAFMWMANAATVSPSLDSLDGKLHLTVANLASNLHRSQEAKERLGMLRRCFEGDESVKVHDPLPSCYPLRDEGAANHMRLWLDPMKPGVEIFVCEPDLRRASVADRISHAMPSTSLFMPRQARLASNAIARRHRLAPERCFLLEQSWRAIQAGVFHNDVIAMSHENLFLYHQDAFEDATEELDAIESSFEEYCHGKLVREEVTRQDLTLDDAVASYLFNGQLVSLPQVDRRETKRMLLLAPLQCEQVRAAKQLIDRWIADPRHPIAQVEFVPLDQSMANGGGPACLRLRVEVSDLQRSRMKREVWLDASSRDWLEDWITRRYPESIQVSDLTDPEMARDALAATKEIYQKFGW